MAQATDEIIVERPAAPQNCDPNYWPCVPIASDVDCAGALNADGPTFVSGLFDVIGVDIYGLDPDEDGVVCN